MVAVDNGEDALRKARELRPDVLVADVVMPRMNGYELCQAVKADPQLADVPVLLLTARSGLNERLEGLNLGADDYLPKPFELAILIARTRGLLRRKQWLRSSAMPIPAVTRNATGSATSG